MYHEHPLRILRYSAKNIWLLIFPLLRGVKTIRFDAESFYNWVRGAWFDIAVIGIIIVFGYIRWHFSGIELTDTEIVRWEGISAKIKTTIPYSSVSSVTVEKPVWLMPVRAIKISCDTSAGNYKSADLQIMVTGKFCKDFLSRVPDVNQKNKLKDIPETTPLSVLLFSVFFSSGLSGTVYIATFFMKGGDIAHDIINVSLDRLTETTEKLAGKLIIRIPSAAVFVGVFFIAAWFISFIMNFFRYYGFGVDGDEYCIKIFCGLFNRREYRITSAHINYTDLRQNLIMKFSGAVAVNISCAGYGSEKNQLPVLFPVRKEKSLDNALEKIGIFTGVKNDFRPKKNGWWQYIWQPVIASLIVFPVHIFIKKYIPEISELLFFFAVMLEILLIWLIAVKLTAFFTSGISVYDDKIMVRCSKMVGFHTVVAERRKLVKFEIQQPIFQKISGKCSIVLWFGGEERSHFKVRAMRVEDVKKISAMLGYQTGERI
ncbi:MAG: PH domain-containing protein [Prevotella sp.]|nr:PH domain-containing protein [Alistipes senegalensis]MCM1358447.1 PH domain-containing protein [Prevotella sp.]